MTVWIVLTAGVDDIGVDYSESEIEGVDSKEKAEKQKERIPLFNRKAWIEEWEVS